MVKDVLLVKGDKGEKRLSVLFDSGASRSLIRSDVAKELSTPRELLTPREFTIADGRKISCTHSSDFIVEIGRKKIGIEAFS
jgi:hypothetical protein